MNILAYVHLRNIYGSTGHGRAARQITEHLAQEPADRLRILADPEDHRKTVHKVGPPWTEFSYHFFESETSRQHARWALTGRPPAEAYWPEAQIVYSTCESYVPTRKARLVVTVHDASVFEAGALPGNWLFFRERLKLKLSHGLVSRKADLIATGSRHSAERLAHFFPEMRSRLRVVPCAVSPCFFSPVSAEGESALRELGLLERPFVLLPGGLNHRKNAALVLRAWPLIHQMHPEVRLVVAGHSDPVYLAPARALGDSVTLTGFVSDEALCALHDAAQVVWFPSLYEGFGLPVLEAMARGTPVVTSNTTSIPEVAGDAGALVSPMSVDENVGAIDHLLRDSGGREELSRRGKIRARQFTWERTASELRRHFLSLV
jgi:glycosyltransferase involved in cell wall biosynthesis